MTDDKKTILIVEDEPALLKVYADGLTEEGFRVLQARDGEEGLAAALREGPNLILLDIVMPKMDGLTMLKKLRAENEWGKYVPVIILTNLDSNAEATNAFASLAYDFLVKSNNSIKDVIKIIKEKINV